VSERAEPAGAADLGAAGATGAPDRPTTRLQGLALSGIEAYQRAAEGRPSPCRFFPSCSEYAHEAFAVHGTRRGAVLTIRRLLRCRPLGPSGFDPVPEPIDRSARRAGRSEKDR
jgi:putative membrane protein insertion efficiency factor